MLIVAFDAPDPTQDYTFSVADARTGFSFSVAKGDFEAAPADELVKMIRDVSPNRAAWRYGVLPASINPPVPGQYLVFIHAADGGQAIGQPFPVVAQQSSPRGFNFAFSF